MKIYLLLSNTGSVPSKIIYFFTKFKYSHVSIGFDKKLNVLYSFGRKYLYSPYPGGFITENIDSGLFKLKKKTKGLLFEVSVSKDQYNNLVDVINEFKENEAKYRYDYRGVIRHYFGKHKNNKDTYFFCSEFVSHVLRASGIHSFDKPNNMIRPIDFLGIKNTKIIYEGRLSDYNKNQFKKPLHLWITFDTILKLIKGTD